MIPIQGRLKSILAINWLPGEETLLLFCNSNFKRNHSMRFTFKCLRVIYIKACKNTRPLNISARLWHVYIDYRFNPYWLHRGVGLFDPPPPPKLFDIKLKCTWFWISVVRSTMIQLVSCPWDQRADNDLTPWHVMTTVHSYLTFITLFLQ